MKLLNLCVILFVINWIKWINADDVKSEKQLNVVVIGAGISGLASAKNAIDAGYNVTIYEQAEGLGGIWRYTNQTGKDQYGVNIHSAVYQGLRYLFLKRFQKNMWSFQAKKIL